MKILYDHQVFSWQVTGGISRYFVELQKRVSSSNSTLISNNLYLHQLKNTIKQLFPNIYIPGKTQLIRNLNKLWTIKIISKQEYDIFHPTYYDNYFIKHLDGKPYVITVFDMIHELFPCEFGVDNTSVLKKNAILGANRIIAISESTKNDLIKLYGLSADKIDVTHLASSLITSKAKAVDLPSKYVLFVGDRSKYKNFRRFYQSMVGIMENDSSINIVCVGGGKFSSSELNSFDHFKNRIRQLTLSDAELVYAYQHAICLVFPSLYEGFGLPVVEAMECGCPVICSNTSSFPEVAGSAALYFDPTNTNEMSKCIDKVISSKKFRENLISSGYLRVKQFSWDKCAKHTKVVYQKALKS